MKTPFLKKSRNGNGVIKHTERDRRFSIDGQPGCCSYIQRRYVLIFFCLTADLICYMDRANISVTMIKMAEEK